MGAATHVGDATEFGAPGRLLRVSFETALRPVAGRRSDAALGDVALSGVGNPRTAGAVLRVGTARLEVVASWPEGWDAGALTRVLTPGEAAVGAAAHLETLQSAAASVLSFWLDEIGAAGWWKPDPAIDREIALRFFEVYVAARFGGLAAWEETPESALALIIVLDQFPRNLYRDDARAFQTDAAARAVADRALARGFDRAIDGAARLFFYMPFEHSEDLADQDRCVALVRERLAEEQSAIRHALAHRDLIRRFGRFPHRNACLGRISTEVERAHLDDGGYRPGAADADDAHD